MDLSSLTRPELIFTGLEVESSESLLRFLADRLAETINEDGARERCTAREIYQGLTEREALGSTAIGDGIALPHCKLKGITEVLLAIAVTADALDFGAADAQGVRGFLVIISPQGAPGDHLKALSVISRWLSDTQNRLGLLQFEDAEQIAQAVSGACRQFDVDDAPDRR